jgi:hypothetical protein
MTISTIKVKNKDLNPRLYRIDEINETDVKDEEDRIDETDGFNDSLAFSYFLW